jgi:hypothetical protein
MKKIIILIITLFVITGCEDYNNYKTIKIVDGFEVIVVDSCEYIYDRTSAGYAGFGFLAHKGNCSFCKERREQDMKKLIEQLKEY